MLISICLTRNEIVVDSIKGDEIGRENFGGTRARVREERVGGRGKLYSIRGPNYFTSVRNCLPEFLTEFNVDPPLAPRRVHGARIVRTAGFKSNASLLAQVDGSAST